MKQTSNINPSARIRQSSAQAISKAVDLLYAVDAVCFSEVKAVKAALSSLVKRGELAQPEKRLLDLHQVSERLAIGESTLKRLLSEGSIDLPKVRLGGGVRFRLSDVEALMDNIEE